LGTGTIGNSSSCRSMRKNRVSVRNSGPSTNVPRPGWRCSRPFAHELADGDAQGAALAPNWRSSSASVGIWSPGFHTPSRKARSNAAATSR